MVAYGSLSTCMQTAIRAEAANQRQLQACILLFRSQQGGSDKRRVSRSKCITLTGII